MKMINDYAQIYNHFGFLDVFIYEMFLMQRVVYFVAESRRLGHTREIGTIPRRYWNDTERYCNDTSKISVRMVFRGFSSEKMWACPRRLLKHEWSLKCNEYEEMMNVKNNMMKKKERFYFKSQVKRRDVSLGTEQVGYVLMN